MNKQAVVRIVCGAKNGKCRRTRAVLEAWSDGNPEHLTYILISTPGDRLGRERVIRPDLTVTELDRSDDRRRRSALVRGDVPELVYRDVFIHLCPEHYFRCNTRDAYLDLSLLADPLRTWRKTGKTQVLRWIPKPESLWKQ